MIIAIPLELQALLVESGVITELKDDFGAVNEIVGVHDWGRSRDIGLLQAAVIQQTSLAEAHVGQRGAFHAVFIHESIYCELRHRAVHRRPGSAGWRMIKAICQRRRYLSGRKVSLDLE